jgi:2-polyprenyl-6-methoxyphenol hydroxylase-like FAD-dependent oxidoreductase
VERADVIVAGGGPVGLCLALLLVEQGLDVTVVEADAEPARDLRASTFHPPTLDMLDEIGIAPALVAAGLPCPHWQVRLHPSGERAVFDLGVLSADTGYPFRLQCEQWKLSDLLRDRLAGRARMMQGARIVSVSQDDGGVAVAVMHRAESGAGHETVRGAFLAGCDGARSIVRASLGLAFDGETYPETTLLATTPFPFNAHLEGLSNVTYCWREGAGNFSLLRVPERWRVSIYPREDAPIEAQTTPEAIEASLQAIVPRAEPYEVLEVRPYRVHMRMAARYRVGRVALAGDAAHINSPAGGMGLNGGLHDTFALARAFADSLHDGAHDAALDLYDRRRRPIARDEIMAQADRNRARMRERDPARRRALLADLQAIAADPARLRAHLLRTSMIEGLRRAQAVT